MIWTPPKNVSVLVAYQKRLCLGDLYLHEYCFVRCHLTGDTGNNSPLHCKNAIQGFSPLFKAQVITILFVFWQRRQWVFREIHYSEHLATVQQHSPRSQEYVQMIWEVRAQGDKLICSVSCRSFMLVRSTHVLHGLLP